VVLRGQVVDYMREQLAKTGRPQDKALLEDTAPSHSARARTSWCGPSQ
jgi:hypothetical protein